MPRVNVYCPEEFVIMRVPRVDKMEKKIKKLRVLLAVFLITTMFLPACAPATADCASEDMFCVGLVTDIGKINDRSFNQSCWEALQQAEKELGARIEYIETANFKDY